MNRRHFLGAAGTTLSLSTAGCSGLFETRTTRSPPMVENRPDAVYIPSHVEGMEMAGMATQGRYRFALSYSFPHRFWTVTGDRTTKVEIREEDTVHLMFTAWDEESGVVVPTSNPGVTIRKDGQTVVSNKQLWPMLSQNMGVHFGDNVALDGDGTYEVSVDFGPIETRRAGTLADAGDGKATPTFEMEFSQSTLEDVTYETLDDTKGQRDARGPMSMEKMPSGQVPPGEALPGERLMEFRGTDETGDAIFAARRLAEPPAGVEAGGQYLAVSALTPYNRYPLPFTSLSASLSRTGETVFDGKLTDTLHPELGYHYGAVVDSVASGDTLSVTVDAPPQVARHEGYETAFLTMDGDSVTL